MATVDQQELLARSAPQALRWAGACCRADPRTGERCEWSHGLWQVLRLMDLVVSPARHAAFYAQAFGGVAGRDGAPPRVLVSGTADYAMPALVLACFRARGIEPELVVLDRCETPLRLAEWHAGEAGASIRTLACDILDCPSGPGYDLICTDSFFGRFAPHERPALVAKWASLLRPDGRLVTVNVVRPGGGTMPLGFSPAQSAAFVAQVRERVALLPEGLPEALAQALDTTPAQLPDVLEARALDYARHHGSYPLASMEELRGLFADAGLVIASLEEVQAGGSGEATGPSVRGPRRYAHVIATRQPATQVP